MHPRRTRRISRERRANIAREPAARRTRSLFVMNESLRLTGNISEISRDGLYGNGQELVTVSVEGAEPLYAELRLPNAQGWVLGQRVMVVIFPSISDSWDSIT